MTKNQPTSPASCGRSENDQYPSTAERAPKRKQRAKTRQDLILALSDAQYVRTAEKRFLSKVVRADNGCLEWNAYRDPQGYGWITIGGYPMKATRFAWLLHTGELLISPAQKMLHNCDNPPCVDISHLRVGTAKENFADAHARGRARRPRGEEHHAAKLTDARVLELRAMRKTTGMTYKSLSAKFGIHPVTVGQIVRGEHRKHPAREPSEAMVNRNKAKALAESNRVNLVEWERDGTFIAPEHRIPGEEWRETKHPGYYVSSLGRVRGRRGYILKPQINARGYAMATFGAGNLRPIHALVCEAWHGPMSQLGMVVAHNDGNRQNNAPENLRWATVKENAADRHIHGTERIGPKNHKTKLTGDQVREILAQIPGPSGLQARLARQYGVSVSTISAIRHSRVWRHIT